MQMKLGQHIQMRADNISTKFGPIPSRHRKWTFRDPWPSGGRNFVDRFFDTFFVNNSITVHPTDLQVISKNPICNSASNGV